MVPIACSKAEQVVLIGDHKQLQPIVSNKVARSFGLNISLFERYAKIAHIMLEEQYRMVSFKKNDLVLNRFHSLRCGLIEKKRVVNFHFVTAFHASSVS